MSFTLTFEVAFDVNPGDEPGVGDWTDLSSRLRDVASVTLGWAPGSSATVQLDNQDRDLDPTNGAAPYNLVPMRHARLTATFDSIDYPLFRGYVETWVPVWPEWNESVVEVVVRDGGMWLARIDTDLDLAGQLTSARVTAILDAAGWPSGLRDIDVGIVRVDGIDQANANLLRSLEDTADAEDGELFFSTSGEVVFRSRHARFGSSSVLTVGTQGSATYPVDAVRPVYDMTQMVNLARVALDNGTVFEAIDSVSRTSYGPADLPVRDLPIAPHEAVTLAQWIVYRFALPTLRLDGLRMLGNEPGVLDDLLTLERGQLVTFEHTPPGGGMSTFTGHVARLVHRISAHRWETTLALEPYFGAGPWMEWYSDAAGSGDAWLSDVAFSGAVWAP